MAPWDGPGPAAPAEPAGQTTHNGWRVPSFAAATLAGHGDLIRAALPPAARAAKIGVLVGAKSAAWPRQLLPAASASKRHQARRPRQVEVVLTDELMYALPAQAERPGSLSLRLHSASGEEVLELEQRGVRWAVLWSRYHSASSLYHERQCRPQHPFAVLANVGAIATNTTATLGGAAWWARRRLAQVLSETGEHGIFPHRTMHDAACRCCISAAAFKLW